MPAKKPATKKTTALGAARKQEVWAGATGITGPRTGDDARNAELIAKVGMAFGIPPIGVNILGGKPYVNKEGLLFKLHEYTGRKKKGTGRLKGIRKEFIQYATKPGDISVCKATIEFDDSTFIEGIGEASALNVSLDKVKTSLNMMAETRAVNRAIRQAITYDLWSEAMDRFANAADIKPADRPLLEHAVTTSLEEVDNRGAKKVSDVAAKSSDDTLQSAVMAAVGKATKKETLADLRGKVELSDKIGEASKKILLSMIDQKLATL